MRYQIGLIGIGTNQKPQQNKNLKIRRKILLKVQNFACCCGPVGGIEFMEKLIKENDIQNLIIFLNLLEASVSFTYALFKARYAACEFTILVEEFWLPVFKISFKNLNFDCMTLFLFSLLREREKEGGGCMGTLLFRMFIL